MNMIGNHENQIEPSAHVEGSSAEQAEFADVALGLGLAFGAAMVLRWLFILSDKLRDWAEKSPANSVARPHYHHNSGNPGSKPPTRGPS